MSDISRICTHYLMCQTTRCEGRYQYCEQEKCLPCGGLCSENRITDESRRTYCWEICPLYMNEQCNPHVDSTTSTTTCLTERIGFYIETTNNCNGSNDSQGPTTDDGNATGLPHEQPLLHNREHGPAQTYPKTMATRCAHPVEDDRHVTICTDTPSVQFGPNHKIVTNATGNKPMTIN
ncbi:hypothetical protein LSH36_285g00008 [Paralvinella palmiformis]|uniref:Uncharacterized protein n=1 Tax=Paralvinella palmiformis TaxID=53620 RepID=A0AAD9JKA9_9ANNE|nr:hypothetical protein LSH36_285g00008 [Paralvinella palmiformis]